MVPPGGGNDGKWVTLSNGQRIDLAEARLFMDYYCTLLLFLFLRVLDSKRGGELI